MFEFNKQNFEAFRQDFKAAIADLEDKYGVQMEMGNIKYKKVDFEMAVKVTDADEEVIVEEEKRLFNMYCKRYGFSTDDYYKTIKIKGDTYAFKGFNTKARKYPVVFVNISDGSEVRMSAMQANVYLRGK